MSGSSDEELVRCRTAIDATDSPSAGARAMIDALTRALEGAAGGSSSYRHHAVTSAGSSPRITAFLVIGRLVAGLALVSLLATAVALPRLEQIAHRDAEHSP